MEKRFISMAYTINLAFSQSPKQPGTVVNAIEPADLRNITDYCRLSVAKMQLMISS